MPKISDNQLAGYVFEATKDGSKSRMELEHILRAQGHKFASLRLVPSVQRHGSRYGVRVNKDGHATRFERYESTNSYALQPAPISSDFGAALELLAETLPCGMQATVTIIVWPREEKHDELAD